MRYYEWRRYKDETVKPVLIKCITHELFGELSGLMADIDRSYRLIRYTKTAKRKSCKGSCRPYRTRRELDQKWLEHDINSKIAYLKDMLIIMKLGS